jgi:hypothetical protein
MLDRLPILALLVLASLPVAAATPAAERTYSVSGFDRVRIDGPYRVDLKTNVAPYAKASGTPVSLDGVSIKVEGRTLVIRSGGGGWGGYPGQGRGPVTIEIGTHDLSAAYINGPGALMVDRVKGLGFEMSIQGAGIATIGQVEVDQMKVSVSGAGTLRMAGRVGKLTSTIRGTSNLEADRLEVKDAVIGAEGPSTVRTQVTNSAKVDANGLASVTLTGDPACTVTAKGSANVVGCKEGRY